MRAHVTPYRLLFTLQLALYLQLYLVRVDLRLLRAGRLSLLCGCTR